MTDKNQSLVEEARSLLAKITPWPWVYMEDDTFWGELRSCGRDADDPTAFSLIAETPDGDERDDDFRFMARAPELVDALATHSGRLIDALEIALAYIDTPTSERDEDALRGSLLFALTEPGTELLATKEGE